MPSMDWSGYDLFLTANLASRTAQQTLARTKRLFYCGALASATALTDFVATQKRLGLSPASLNKFIAAARHYSDYRGLSWLLPKHQREHSKIRRTFSDDEIIKLIEVEQNQYSDFFRIVAMTGCRPQEALALTSESYDPANECLVLHGYKTYEDRLIPVKGLNVNWSALPFRFCHDSANNELKRRCTKLQIPYRSLYSFRHSFATRLINGDANLLAVKTLMGHNSLDTTAIYYHSSLRSLQAAIERDTLNLSTMTPNEKLLLWKKHLSEMIERLHADSDHDLDVHLDQKTNQISFTVKVKKDQIQSK